MVDRVWEVTGQPVLTTYNGFGSGLRGFTRVDGSGRCFATRWLLALYLPVFPLTRYYLSEHPLDPLDAARHSYIVLGRYQIDGESRPRAAEILRTYAFWWLIVPLVGPGPLLLVGRHLHGVADTMSTAQTWMSIAGFLLWPFLVIWGLTTLRDVYRRRWAPLRTVTWVDPPPSVTDWPDDRLPPDGWRFGDD
ncbi:hypothetical protein AB0M54_44340 [Actinoplanes sp. NPDC051470]|uniref:hypothetical protein n=1 Tax=unclassified Actinoplanes TaxID=2626549 RepID=UPI00342D06DC